MKEAFRNFSLSPNIYNPSDIRRIIKEVRQYFSVVGNGIKYYNCPSAFDIETTSFFRATGKGDQEKRAIMYMWSFGIYGKVIIGRKWDEFVELLDILVKELKLYEKRRLIIYVHNLQYEFQFMRKWMEFKKVFAIDSRRPVYAITKDGIEFRCSYLLSGYSLESVGNQLQTYIIKKLVGFLDYDKLRHNATYITQNEMDYSANDVRVVMAYIMEKIEHDGDITKIPLTKTGYVREYCRNHCFYENGVKTKKSYKRLKYLDLMRQLTLTVDEYKHAKKAFGGGFTHCSAFVTNLIIDDVESWDFTSSYLAVICAEKFPMSKGECIRVDNRELFLNCVKNYCCVFDVEIIGLEAKVTYENYISESRCIQLVNPEVNNGRLVKAKHLITTITNIDYVIISQLYKWDEFRVGTFYRYEKDYLPRDFVASVLKFYGDKTQLKGVEGKENEYQSGKEMGNSTYGMMVMDIVRGEFKYINGDWQPLKDKDYEKEINKYNNSSSRFLYYLWGVFVTAYARRNLFSGIIEYGKDGDYCYSDTDSIKGINSDNHKEYRDKYNQLIIEQLEIAMDHHGLPRDLIRPKTREGVEKPLGVWDFDGNYKRFKTLGAKRYLVEYSDDPRNGSDCGKIQLTVSGINKKKCVPWMISKYGVEGIFEKFNNRMEVPGDYTGKMTMTYVDDEIEGDLIDYNGVKGHYFERSYIHSSKSEYKLSLAPEYVKYFTKTQEQEISG